MVYKLYGIHHTGHHVVFLIKEEFEPSHLKDVLPGLIYVSFGGEASHDHCMELRKLKRQKHIEIVFSSYIN